MWNYTSFQAVFFFLNYSQRRRRIPSSLLQYICFLFSRFFDVCLGPSIRFFRVGGFHCMHAIIKESALSFRYILDYAGRAAAVGFIQKSCTNSTTLYIQIFYIPIINAKCSLPFTAKSLMTRVWILPCNAWGRWHNKKGKKKRKSWRRTVSPMNNNNNNKNKESERGSKTETAKIIVLVFRRDDPSFAINHPSTVAGLFCSAYCLFDLILYTKSTSQSIIDVTFARSNTKW